MPRKSWLLQRLLSIAFLLSLVSSVTAADRPNVVVFLVDDMGVMDTSVPFLTDEQNKPKRYPLNDFYRTPSMERLASSGVRFNQFYAMSVCSPTRISLMTGRNAARHRATNWINPSRDNRGPQGPPDWNWTGLGADDATLAKLMRDAGYRTIHVGKGHFGPHGATGEDPLNLGFDINIGGSAFGAPGSYYGSKNYGLGTRREHNAVPHLEKYHGTDTYLTEALTIEANRQLDAAVAEDQPFYLYMSHYAVHAPFESDPRFAAHYKDSGKSDRAQAFATMIEGMDHSLGQLLDHLEELGVAEETLVLFLGDNGSDAPLGHQHAVACAAPLRGKKGAHYEGGMRVPFIAAWAKPDASREPQRELPIPAGSLNAQIASVEDILPTLASILELDVPRDYVLDGSDITPSLLGEPDADRRDEFLMHYPHAPHRSDYFTVYRLDDWKVVYHYYPSDVSNNMHYELFNLSEDPFESNDLSQSHPEQLRRMMQELASQLEQHDALYPISDDGDQSPLKPIIP